MKSLQAQLVSADYFPNVYKWNQNGESLKNLKRCNIKSYDYPVASVPAFSCQPLPPLIPKISGMKMSSRDCFHFFFSASGRARFSTLRKSDVFARIRV